MKPRLIILITVILALVAGYAIFNMRDNRDLGERISDAAGELSDGVGSAAEQLEDKSPAEQLVDDAKGAIDDAKEKIDQQP
jgi:hypothetical protein